MKLLTDRVAVDVAVKMEELVRFRIVAERKGIVPWDEFLIVAELITLVVFELDLEVDQVEVPELRNDFVAVGVAVKVDELVLVQAAIELNEGGASDKVVGVAGLLALLVFTFVPEGGLVEFAEL